MAIPAEQTALPPLFRRHIRRPRLTRLIDASTAQSVIVTGPAGFGKTTLVAEWAQGKDGIVWYRSTSASADVAAFSVGVADVVAPIVPNAGARLRHRVRVAEPPEKAARPLAEILSEDLAGWPEGARLIIDDYHLVADSTAVEDFVDWLLTLTPALRVLVTTRRRPAWASARRVLYGEVTEIGQEQLAMTNEEAGQVLDDRPTEAVRALVQQAQGWPAVIGLAALSASTELPSDRISEALFRYFAEEVFRQEPPDVQEFMLLASVPISLTSQVARDVLDFPHPQSLFDRLKLDGLLRESEGHLRYHPLVRDYLRHRLQTERPDVATALTLRAISAARAAGWFDEAFDLATAAGMTEIAAEITADSASSLLYSGRIETLEKWLISCETFLFRSLPVGLAKVQVLTLRGRLAEATALAAELAAKVPSSDAYASRASFLAGQAFHVASNYERALHYHLAAKQLAKTKEDLGKALWGAFVSVAENGGEGPKRYLDELEQLAGSDLDGRLRVGTGRQLLAGYEGNLAGVWETVEGLLPLVDYCDDPMARSTFVANVAYLCAARADYRQAYALASRCEAYCRELRLDFAIGTCLSFRAVAEIGLRLFRNAKATLRAIGNAPAADEDPFLAVTRACLYGRLALAQNRPQDVRLSDLPTGDLVKPTRGEFFGLLAMAAASLGDARSAKQWAARARELTTAIEAQYFSKFAEVLADAVSRPDAHRSTHSAAALVREVADVDFLDSLVVAYRAYPPLLRLITADPDAVAIALTALRQSNDHRLAHGFGHPFSDLPQPGATSVLTTREIEVLSLIELGLSNVDIAQRLYLSPSTVKVHVHHILKKLEVRSRLQAVLKFREYVQESNGNL